MKRVFSVLVAMLLVAVLLTSCGKKAVDSSEPDTQSSTVASDHTNESGEQKESADAQQSNTEQPISSVSTPTNAGTSPDHKTPNKPNRNENTNTPSNSTPTTAPKAPEKPAATTTTRHQHTYKNYKCTGCGEMDHAHAYDFFLDLAQREGSPYGTYVKYLLDDDGFSLTYDAHYDTLSIEYSVQGNNGFEFSSLYLSSFFFGTTIGDLGKVTGYIDPKTYRRNSPISEYEYEGDPNNKYRMLEEARIMNEVLVAALDRCSKEYGFSIKDFGFEVYGS